jgi:hypothetical protein
MAMPSLPSTAFTYEQCDIPEGLTIDEWKHGDESVHARGLVDRLFGRRWARHGRD